MPLARLVALAAGAAALAACRDSTSPAAISRAAVAGTYVLQTIDGKALPVATYATSFARVVTADTLTLNADGTWADRTSGSATAGDSGRGTWTVHAKGITLQGGNGGSGPGYCDTGQWCFFGQLGDAPVDGRTLTLTTSSQVYGATGPGYENAVWTIQWAFRRQ